MNRKDNRLKNYDYSQNGAYFITICVKDMECILSKISENKTNNVGADTIRPRLTKYGVIVDNAINSIESHYDTIIVDRYVIMPNHIHLMIRINNNKNIGRMVSAPTVIGSLKRFVSKEIGFSIWQKSYYDHIIRNDEDYINHLQYIDENPKKWLLGKDEYYV
ncbi:MAG: transposase [Eubacterium sp.]|nr:transposase [Eubacterium sp.]